MTTELLIDAVTDVTGGLTDALPLPVDPTDLPLPVDPTDLPVISDVTDAVGDVASGVPVVNAALAGGFL